MLSSETIQVIRPNIDHTHPLILPVPFAKPICLTADGSKFHLDMSFNRDGPHRDHQDRSIREIGPLDSPSGVEGPPLIPSNIVNHASRRQWREHFAKWDFPIRTDSPRGLTWGPYPLTPEAPTKRSIENTTPPLLVRLKIKQTHAQTNEIKAEMYTSSISPRKRSRSKSLADDLVTRDQPKRSCNLKPSDCKGNSSKLFTSNSGTLKSSVGTIDDHNQPLYKSRIRLCVASQLKYAS
ncbi:hypothetical protein DFH28DRAFT_1092319 [Melampsora americana]|nr:hypothetical protein DFH28DRAFT_1092319 [Melampsora americana]